MRSDGTPLSQIPWLQHSSHPCDRHYCKLDVSSFPHLETFKLQELHNAKHAELIGIPCFAHNQLPLSFEDIGKKGVGIVAIPKHLHRMRMVTGIFYLNHQCHLPGIDQSATCLGGKTISLFWTPQISEERERNRVCPITSKKVAEATGFEHRLVTPYHPRGECSRGATGAICSQNAEVYQRQG